MSGTDQWATVEDIRTQWNRTDDVINNLREVHADLESLHENLVRNRADEADRRAALAAIDRLGGVDQAKCSFLSKSVLPEEQTLTTALRQGSTITPEADNVAVALEAYGADGAWSDVDGALNSILDAPDHPMGVDSRALSEVVRTFELAVEAAVRRRDQLEQELQAAMSAAYEAVDEPLGPLTEQPVALLPVRLETRFVDENGQTAGPREELLVRVYPDQIHADSHEDELTEKEITWAKNFWATLWYARHPDPAQVGDDPSTAYLQEKLPAQRLRERVTDIDPSRFSEGHASRYAELKERAWQQLLERFGRERASYVVHALKPTDEEFANNLLTEPPESPLAGDGGEDQSDGGDGSNGQFQSEYDIAADQFSEEDVVIDEDTIQPGPDLPRLLPALEFPDVPRKPQGWTKQAQAKLLPDRWVAVAEWEDHTGESQRTAIAGEPVRDPLAVGPSAESVAGESLDADSDAGSVPEGLEWMVDFREAMEVGMGLRLPLTGLAGFDPERGFDRLSVVGVRASVEPTDGADELADLLDAHHYTDGLSFMPQGTPTNNHEETAGEDEEFAEGLSVEASPPLVEDGDLSDGDLLARALSIDPGEDEDHVFANVANADSTEQRDARHVNSALWPATIGYSMEHLYVDNDVVGNPSLRNVPDEIDSWSVGPPDRDDVETEMLWLDAYRRHFIRYVRARGPFPTMRVGNQPYGILPASPIETEMDLSLLDPTLIADLGAGQLDLSALDQQNTSVQQLAANGAEPTKLLDSGAEPQELVDAGVNPKRLVSGGVAPEEAFDATGLVPQSMMQDGVDVRSRSRVTEARLEKEGIAREDLDAAGITPRALARGEVTDQQLDEAGVTTEQIASVLLPEKARAMGLTPSALERAGVTPGRLLRGEFREAEIEKLGLTTRGVADAALPQELRDLGVTPKTIQDAGITPKELLNGEISPAKLSEAGIDTETIAEALLPPEAIEAGVTPEKLASADLTAADLLNGDVGLEELEAAGFDVGTLANNLLPDPFREAGITPENLLDAGITPDAVLNGQITPEDLVDAGLTPTNLAEAGVLPDAVEDVSQVITDLLDAGLDPLTLVERGLTPDALVDAGVTPQTLVEAGLAPKRLVDAGVDVVEIAASGAASGGKLLDAGVSPAKLARAGVTVADMAGGDVPVKELATTGATALELAQEGADALDLASSGARPSSLREANVDAGTLRDAGKAAGSLRTAGYTAEELLESGYTVEELLNGGFSTQELSAAGVDPSQIEGRRRDISSMLAAGHAPEEFKQAGFAPEQLIEAGVDEATLVEAGYTAGELVDAGAEAGKLLDGGLTVEELRAADVSTQALAQAGVDVEQLREHGATAEELIDLGRDPQELLDAGFEQVELDVAGVDVDALAEEAVDGDLSEEEATDAAVEGLQYAATVLEDPEQAEHDAYSFSFDPAIPKGPSRSKSLGGGSEDGEPDDESAADGGVQSGTVPVARPMSIDDQLDGRLERELRGVGKRWQQAATSLPFGHDLGPDGLVTALQRSGLSTTVRHRTLLYSGERIQGAYMSFQEGVCKTLLKPRARQLRWSLSTVGLDDRDPRITYFAPIDGGPEDPWINTIASYHNSARTRPQYQGADKDALAKQTNELWGLLDWHLNVPRQDTIQQYDMVDADIGNFIDVLVGSSVKEVHSLGFTLQNLSDRDVSRWYRTSNDETISLIDATDEEWANFDDPTKRRKIVRAIETADDPARAGWNLPNATMEDWEQQKIQTMGTNQQDHGDTGVLRSLLRILLRYGYLHEYLTARRRLGLAYDDLPYPWFDPAYANYDDQTMMETLQDDIPDVLEMHPDINPGDTEWYREALQDAAANYSSTTSIDPRISEFTDSLRYLAGVDPDDLTTLTRETMDLATHRLDAWWTSLATKRLFELREVQGTVDPEGKVDHEAWSGAGSEVPRATLDPALVGAMSEDGAGTHPAVTDPAGMTRQFDPAALTGDASGQSGDTPSPDGGVDPTAERGPSAGGARGQGGTTEDSAIDSEQFETNAAERFEQVDPAAIDPAAASEPGLYVGGYGFVENLSADTEGRDDPEYVHAPSEQHATTAAILKSGADAHDADEGENALALDLSADRIRAGLRLIRGVRRGQSLGELLGYRFERRMHEATVEYDEPDLMQYADVFRKEFPQQVGKVKKPDENDRNDEGLEELAARETVDGLALVEDWEQYPFGRDANLPGMETAAYQKLNEIVTDLDDDIDAAGDMLVAESVHQIGQGNFDRAGGSLDALAKGEQLPDPDVVEAPRSETGLTHRQHLLMGETSAPVGTPRGEAAPSLASWVAEMLPDLSAVQCTGTYRWEEPADKGSATPEGEATTVEREHSTTMTLDALDLGPLDVLLLFGASREETRSELEQRLAYHMIRTRPSDPAVPADAEVELELTETGGEVSVADLLELARSLREFVQSARPAHAADLTHPGDADGEGYTAETATTLRKRAADAQDTLYSTAEAIDERLALFDAEHEVGDGVDGLPTPPGATSDGGAPAGSSWANMDGSVYVPKDRSPAIDTALAMTEPPLPERIDDIVAAVERVDERVPLDAVKSVADALDPSAIRDELSTLVAALPAGSASTRTASADQTVESASNQLIDGTLLHAVDVPDVDPGSSEDTDGEADGEGFDLSQSGPIAYGEVKPASEDIMSVSETTVEQVEMTERPEIQYSEMEYAAERLNMTQTGEQSVDVGSLEIDDSSDDSTEGGDGDQSGGDESEDGDTGLDIDWSTSTVTVRIWGTDGTSTFQIEKSVTPDSDGDFELVVDFSAVDPGTSFQIVGIVDGVVMYSATGRVVADDDLTADAQSTVRSSCPNLKRLLWLVDHESLLSTDEGVSADFVAAHGRVDEWARIRAERDGVDPATSTITSEEIAALTRLADLESFDPAAAPDGLEATTAPATRLGVDRIVSQTGDGNAPDDRTFWVRPTPELTGMRARIERTLDDPSLYNAGAGPRLLKYDHDAGGLLHTLTDGEGVVASAYLDAFLAQPAWVLRYLDRELDAAAATITQHLTTWLYDPDSLDQSVDLGTELRHLATAARKLPALTALFEGLPRGDAATRHEAFAAHLDAIASAMGSGGGVSSSSDPAGAFDTAVDDATKALRSAVTTEASVVGDIASGPAADEAFRKAALEQLREPMTVAASYGVYGGTPSEPDGGSVEATRALLVQARALLERLRGRITDAGALDPRIHGDLSNQPVAQRVETQTDRLERLFGDGFTVLPPFTPANPDELAATFTDDSLLPDDRSLAAETWLQRSAAHRERVQKFREARSYAEAIAQSLTPSLTVGQVPYQEGDTWVGVEGVDPDPGRISMVTQFGPGLTPSMGEGQIVGLAVDEWTESIPAEEETTAVALNYDDPGNRPPQSILLVPPPSGGRQSLDHIAAAVAETATYAKRRSVTLADFDYEPSGDNRRHMDPPFGLFPALHFVDQNASPPDLNDHGTPNINLDMLDWYDKKLTAKLMLDLPEMQGGDSE